MALKTRRNSKTHSLWRKWRTRQNRVNREKQLTAKRAWGHLQERARLGEKFGQIAMLGLLYKSGELSRARVLELLQELGVTREDLKNFREQRSH